MAKERIRNLVCSDLVGLLKREKGLQIGMQVPSPGLREEGRINKMKFRIHLALHSLMK